MICEEMHSRQKLKKFLDLNWPKTEVINKASGKYQVQEQVNKSTSG